MVEHTTKPPGIRWQAVRFVALATLLCCALGTAGANQEQNVRFNRLSLEHGLSQSSVNCIVQDRQGLMWFGTQDGLNRYDGYGFTVFKHDAAEPGSLSHNFIWALYVDDEGTLWIGTEGGGLERWNPVDDTFHHYRHDPDDPESLGNDRIRSIAGAPSGGLWIGTESGLDRFDPRTGVFTHYRHDPDKPGSLGHEQIRSVFVDRSGTLWIGTEGGGLDRLDPDGTRFEHYRHDDGDPRSLSSDRVRTIHEDRDGTLWVGTYEGGLNRLDRETGTFTFYVHDSGNSRSLTHDRVRTVFQDSEGTLWVGTDGGLNRWNPETEEFVVYRHDAADSYSLSNDRVLSVYQDRGGLLWVATQAGLNRWNPTVGSFPHLRQDGQAESTLSSNIVTALTRCGDGMTWIGTYGGGLDSMSPDRRTYTHHRHDPADPGSLADDRVMSVLCDRDRTVWVGTLEGGLGHLDPAVGRFEHFRHDPEDPESLSANGVTSLYEDRDGSLWVGTYRGGLNHFDRRFRKFRTYRHDPDDPTSLGDDRVMSIYADADGKVWVGTEGGGLNRLDPATGKFVRFRHDPSDPEALTSDTVWSILEGRDSVMWIGTQGGGLLRWDPGDRASLRGRFTSYTERDGLPNAFIYGILEDDLGNLWLSTNKGLSRFDPSAETFTNYDVTHGLQSNEFNFGAYHRAADGEMLFGGNNGFNAFEPEQIRQNGHVPPVALTGIYKLNEKVRLEKPIWDTMGIVLDYRDHVVSFEFSALDFSAPEKNRYAYKLEGFDTGWNDLGNLRRATYTNLDAGKYVFRVRGSNNDGRWNDAGAALAVTVLPPPWKTWWAYTLYSLFAMGLMLTYTRAQAKKLQREAEYSRKLEHEVQERTAELEERNSDLAEANEKLEEASLTDSLTGLRNRRYLMSYLQEDIALVHRHYAEMQRSGEDWRSRHPDFLFLMIDLDGFKPINDTYGHEAGDRVLTRVCQILDAKCRTSDTVIRWGGDEFLLVCRDTDRDAAETLAERIRSGIANAGIDVGGGHIVRVRCSIGYAFYPFVPSHPTLVPWEKVLAIADRALYVAKDSGRDAWVGIVSTEKDTPDDLIPQILELPDRMAREEIIAVTSNLVGGERELVWKRG